MPCSTVSCTAIERARTNFQLGQIGVPNQQIPRCTRLGCAGTPPSRLCRRRWTWYGEPSLCTPAQELTIASPSNHTPLVLSVNGEPRPLGGLHLSAHDRGLTLADGLFETMRTHGGTVFRLDRHLARLKHGLATLGIPIRSELRDWVLDAVRIVGGNTSVRLTVTRGVSTGGVAPPVDIRPTVIIAVNLLPVFPPATYDLGLSAHVASGCRNERSMTAGLKTLSYTDGVAAMLEAWRHGADEALFLDTDLHCSEAAFSNLFIWAGDTLVTPPASCGALPGITREAVMELAAADGIPVTVRPFDLGELLGAQEAFLTSSLRGLAPLVRVGDRPIGSGAPGEVTGRLSAAYAALVARLG